MEQRAEDLQRRIVELVRALGLHQPDGTAWREPIGASEAYALLLLEDAGSLRVWQLAEQLVLEKSTVSRLVTSMSQRGLVKLKPDPSDKRGRLVTLTAAGRRAAASLRAARSAQFERVLQRIAPDRRDDIISALSELADAARSAVRRDSDAVS